VKRRGAGAKLQTRWGVAALTALVFLGMVLLLAGVLTVWGRVESPAAIAVHLRAAGPALGVFRLALALVLIGGWPHWVEVLARVYGLSHARQTELARLRWRLAAWLIVLELILVQEVAVQALGGPAG